MTARLPTTLFVAMFLLYFSTGLGFFVYGDDISMLDVTQSIVQRHSLSVRSVTFPASAIGADGNHYSKYGLGQSLLAIPFYVAGSLVETVFRAREVTGFGGVLRTSTSIYVVCTLGMLAMAGVDVLLYLCSRTLGFGPVPAFLAALCLGVGTFAWQYSRTFLADTTSMLTIFAAFYALLTLGNRARLRPIVTCGVMMSWALVIRIGNIAALLPIAVWLLGKLLFEPELPVKRFATYVASFVAVVLVGLLVIGLYDQARFGNPFETGYGAEASHFTTPLWVGLYGLVLSPGKGLFEYAPILIVGCLGWLYLLREHRSPALVMAAVVLANLVFYARWYEWWGGGVWGPRFMVPVLPFMALGIPAVLVRARSIAQRCLIGALALVSVGIQVLSMIVPVGAYVQRMEASAELFERYLWSPADSPIVDLVRTFLAGDYRPELAPVQYESALLAAIQVAALVVALVLLGSMTWGLLRAQPVPERAAAGGLASDAQPSG
jgi:hypothetical protein